MNTSRMIGLAALLALAGCGDTTEPQADLYGRYKLARVNQSPLPALFLDYPTSRVELTSGALRLNRDGTYTDSTEMRITVMLRGDPVPGGLLHRTDVSFGTYEFDGDSVRFSSTRGENYAMYVQASGTVTQELGGAVLTYRK